MRFRITSFDIKEKIFFAFFIYSFISFSISVTSFVLFREIEKIHITTQYVSSLRNKIQQYIRLDNDFLLYENINPQFFLTGESDYVHDQERVVEEALLLVDSILLSERALAFQLDEDMKSFKELFKEKEFLRKTIFNNIYLIGFKDYGYTGQMRTAIHSIERIPKINLASLLMVRRHEKDYFLRYDPIYILKHQNEREIFKREVIFSKNLNTETKNEILKYLDTYIAIFEKIVELESHTGHRNKMGLMHQMRAKTLQIDSLINSILHRAEKTKSDIVYKIQMVIVIMVTLSIILLLLLAVSFNFVVKSGKF